MNITNKSPVALVTGSSGGLGLAIARTFLEAGYRVVITGRDVSRLDAAKASLGRDSYVAIACGDVSEPQGAADAVQTAVSQFGRLDVLVNCVGTSDRGLAENLTLERLDELIRQNVHTALLCSVAAIPQLEIDQGVIVNIGSLASKVGARYLGGYVAAKHALAGLTQQMRLELKPRGIHVGLVNPGPIRRDDAGSRYQSRVEEDANVPAAAAKPGGGTKIKGLPPESVANAVLHCVRYRRPDLVLPRYLRLLIAVGHISPRLGDWLLLKFTSSKG
ncbi:short-chain dehydrogenase/reductase SDR [Rhodopirellula maiorica SM1]|uniref:Short-chain dehydrogenase/reductase SDR n=1 Tax=Rhodopirellula maiorica SM1 TaxID=1265738 RepID=M5RR42_9BACT|nr:SDR family oxidoreductase [Rhodopirellula maiorica]EMI17847.1 short-chain dehydrogenase/reductase SDR [Rhodopirellula maiorica SM1]